MVCGATVIACGSFDASPDDAQTDDAGADGGVVEGTPQPGAADASDAADAQTDAGGDGGAPGFTIESPDISVAAGDEAITCYYFHAPNGSDVMVKSFQSSLSSGIKHLALLFTASDRMAPGTVSATGCSMSPATADRPAWGARR